MDLNASSTGADGEIPELGGIPDVYIVSGFSESGMPATHGDDVIKLQALAETALKHGEQQAGVTYRNISGDRADARRRMIAVVAGKEYRGSMFDALVQAFRCLLMSHGDVANAQQHFETVS